MQQVVENTKENCTWQAWCNVSYTECIRTVRGRLQSFKRTPTPKIFVCMYYVCTICSILMGNSERIASWYRQDAVGAGVGHRQPIAHVQTLEKRSLWQHEPHSLVQRHKLQCATVRGSVLISSLLRQLPFRMSSVIASAGTWREGRSMKHAFPHRQAMGVLCNEICCLEKRLRIIFLA